MKLHHLYINGVMVTMMFDLTQTFLVLISQALAGGLPSCSITRISYLLGPHALSANIALAVSSLSTLREIGPPSTPTPTKH